MEEFKEISINNRNESTYIAELENNQNIQNRELNEDPILRNYKNELIKIINTNNFSLTYYPEKYQNCNYEECDEKFIYKLEINNKSTLILKCIEYSHPCNRNCNSSNFKFDIFFPNNKKLATFISYCNCTMILNYFNEKKFILKKSFCSFGTYLNIYDENDNNKYRLEIPFCQLGYFCKTFFCLLHCCFSCCFCCCNIKLIYGNIYNKETKMKYNKVISGIIKKNRFYFNIDFPFDTNIWEKLNIIFCVLNVYYIDYSRKKNFIYYSLLIIFLLFCIVLYLIFFT